jgi:hypothetical protein
MRQQLLDDLKETRGNWKLKEETWFRPFATMLLYFGILRGIDLWFRPGVSEYPIGPIFKGHVISDLVDNGAFP